MSVWNSKKSFTWRGWVGLLALALLLAGCWRDQPEVLSPETLESVSAKREGLICTGIWGGYPWAVQLVNEMSASFIAQHPGVRIDMVYDGAPGEELNPEREAERIVKMVLSGVFDRDVVGISPKIYALVGEALDDPKWGVSHLVDFAEEGILESHIEPIRNRTAIRRVGGMVPGPYIQGSYFSVFYNEALGERLGLDVGGEALSFDRLLLLAEQVQEYNKSSDLPVSLLLNSGHSHLILFRSLLLSAVEDAEGGNLPKGRLGQSRRDESLLKTFQAFEALGKRRALLAKKKVRWGEVDAALPFLSARILFMFARSDAYTQAVAKDSTGHMASVRLLELPVFQPMQAGQAVFEPSWAVMKYSPNRGLAVEWMKYWCRPERASEWARLSGNPTGLLGSDDDPAVRADFLPFHGYMHEKYGDRLVDPSGLLIRYWGAQSGELGFKSLWPLLEGLLRGNMSAADALDEIRALRDI